MKTNEQISKTLELKKQVLEKAQINLESNRKWLEAGLSLDNKPFAIIVYKEIDKYELEIIRLSEQIKVLEWILDF